jgi:predicted metal-binding membrane protein
MISAALARALRHDRWLVLLALLAISALALGYTAWLATDFDMSAMMAPRFAPWSAGHVAFMSAMWVVMMIGMMTPSVAPMVLIYAGIARQAAARGTPFAAAGWFAFGYLLAWIAFALVATLAQWWLESRALIAPMMAGTSRVVGGVVLMAAGVYQWLPVKQACLTQCSAPLAFVQRHGGFASSARGSVRLGLLHGLYCIGCCWTLMALLFVFGVMNLAWIAGLMVYVLLERLVPQPRVMARVAGLVAIGAGLWLCAGGGQTRGLSASAETGDRPTSIPSRIKPLSSRGLRPPSLPAPAGAPRRVPGMP